MAKGNFGKSFVEGLNPYLHSTSNLIARMIMQNAQYDREDEQMQAELKQKELEQEQSSQSLRNIIQGGEYQQELVPSIKEKTPSKFPMQNFGNKYETVNTTQESFKPMSALEKAITYGSLQDTDKKALDYYEKGNKPEENEFTNLKYDDPKAVWGFNKRTQKMEKVQEGNPFYEAKETFIVDEPIGDKLRPVYGVPDENGEYEYNGKRYSQIKKGGAFEKYTKRQGTDGKGADGTAFSKEMGKALKDYYQKQQDLLAGFVKPGENAGYTDLTEFNTAYVSYIKNNMTPKALKWYNDFYNLQTEHKNAKETPSAIDFWDNAKEAAKENDIGFIDLEWLQELFKAIYQADPNKLEINAN